MQLPTSLPVGSAASPPAPARVPKASVADDDAAIDLGVTTNAEARCLLAANATSSDSSFIVAYYCFIIMSDDNSDSGRA